MPDGPDLKMRREIDQACPTLDLRLAYDRAFGLEWYKHYNDRKAHEAGLAAARKRRAMRPHPGEPDARTS